MILNKTIALYFLGLLAVALAVLFPSLSWLSPFTYMVIFPIGAILLWKNDGRSLWDLGFRFDRGWFRKLAIGLLFGLAIPIAFQSIQILGGWITLTRRMDPVPGLIAYIPVLLLKMTLLVAVEEFVFRGFFLQSLSRSTGFRVATLLSSLLWGLGHFVSMIEAGLTFGSTLIGMTTFLLWGVTLCLCYLKAEVSLWLPYGLHLGINLCFSLIGLPFIVQPHASQWWIGHPAWSPETGLIGVTGWLICALVLYCLTGNKIINEFAARVRQPTTGSTRPLMD